MRQYTLERYVQIKDTDKKASLKQPAIYMYLNYLNIIHVERVCFSWDESFAASVVRRTLCIPFG